MDYTHTYLTWNVKRHNVSFLFVSELIIEIAEFSGLSEEADFIRLLVPGNFYSAETQVTGLKWKHLYLIILFNLRKLLSSMKSKNI